MRLLSILELYSSGDLSGISMWNDLYQKLEVLDRLGHRHFCEWVLPKAKGTVGAGEKGSGLWWDDARFDRPWLRPHFWGPETIVSIWPPPPEPYLLEQIHPKRGQVLYDYVLSQKYLHSSLIACATYVEPNRWHQQIEVPVVTWLTETGLAHQAKWAMRSAGGEALMLASGLSGPVMTLNDYDRDEFLNMAGKYLNTESLQALSERTYIVHASGDFSAVDQRREQYEAERAARRASTGRVVAFQGGVIEPARRMGPLAELCWQEAQAGTPVDVVYKTQHRPARNPFAEWNVDLETGVGHARYVDCLGQGDVLICGNQYEGTGLAYLEAIRSGMLPVLLGAPWLASRLPEGYPLIAKNPVEFKVALRLAATAHDVLRKEWQARLIEGLEPWGDTAAAVAYDDTIEEVMAPVVARNLDTVQHVTPAFDLLEKAAYQERWKEITDLDVVYKAMTARSRAGMSFKFVTPLALRWMLRACGYRDTDEAELRLVRTQ